MGLALECFGVVPSHAYLNAVKTLEDLLLCNPPYVRPESKPTLAPFDQASQHPVFPGASDRGSPEDFLEWARTQPHPAALPPPSLPVDLEAAIVCVWECGSSVGANRASRLRTVQTVSYVLEPLSRELCRFMCSSAKQIARAMHLNLVRRSRPEATLGDIGDAMWPMHYGFWCAILDALHWPQRDLVVNLVRGFRTVGQIPDSGLWRPVDRPASMSFDDFKTTNPNWVYECRGRVRARAKREPSMVEACWVATVKERDAGLIYGPFTITQLNKPSAEGYPGFGFGMWRPLPRYAIWNGVKWRCIDNAALSLTNQAGTGMTETIYTDRADAPLRVGVRFHELGAPRDEPLVHVCMGGGTDDAFSAYSRVPGADEGYTTVMVAVPANALYPGSPSTELCFRKPGLNFGLVCAPVLWYCVPEPLVAFSRRAFGVPVTRFYDDHQVSEPSYAAGSGQAVHFQLHEIARFHFDIGKHTPWGRTILYTGVLTDWTNDSGTGDGCGVVYVGATRDRRDKIMALVDSAVERGSLSPTEASSVRGKARFCVAPVFGRLGVAVVHLLRKRQIADDTSEIDAELMDALAWLKVAVDLLPPFEVRLPRDIRPPLVVLTDASFEIGHTWIGFVVCCPWNGMRWAGAPSPDWLMRLLASHKERQTYIGQLEAVVCASPCMSLPESYFRNRTVLHYVDNQGALYSLINGRSNDFDMNRIVFVTLMRHTYLSCNVWFEYVPSASNIADLPTRLDSDAIARLNSLGSRVPLQLPPAWCLGCSHVELARLLY